jgi:hypothetical protein
MTDVSEQDLDELFDARIRACTEQVKQLCDDLEKREPSPNRGVLLGALRAAFLILDESTPGDVVLVVLDEVSSYPFDKGGASS